MTRPDVNNATSGVPVPGAAIAPHSTFSVPRPMNYPGGKNNTYFHIINQIPPHRAYIEPFLGSGAVLRHKRGSMITIGMDLDRGAVAAVRDALAAGHAVSGGSARAGTYINGVPAGDHAIGVGEAAQHAGNGLWRSPHSTDGVQVLLLVGDAFDLMASYPFRADDFVYLDPPYLMSSRKSQRNLYTHEMTRLQHDQLLDAALSLECMVMISGYQSALYAERLASWRLVTFEAATRSGATATEHLWMNYGTPECLHDTRYLGVDWRDRQRMHRMQRRWIANLQALPALERQAMLRRINEEFDLVGTPSASL